MAIWRSASRSGLGPKRAATALRPALAGRISRDFMALAGFLVLVFVAGGGSRADMISLVLIRPVAILLAAWWALRLGREQIAENRWLFAFGGAILGLVAVHLLPLPPALWQSLPGHEIIAQVDRAAALGELWRPLSIAPEATRNALFSLSVPVAVGLGLVHLSRDERRDLLPVIIGLAAASLFLSLAQDAAPGATALWFHRVTNAGDPVGLFANRNHNAVFLAALLPLMAAWVFGAEDRRGAAVRKAIAATLALLTVIAIIVAGSRAGLIALGLSLAGSLLLIPKPTATPRNSRLARLASPLRLAIAAVLLLAAVAGVAYGLRQASGGSGDALDRLGTTSTSDFRVGFWQRTAGLVPDYLPLGSGAGSFVEAYQHEQPEDTVGPQYVNHAHNDYLEVALTLGVPGMLLLAALLGFLGARAWRAWRTPAEGRRNVRLARAASLTLAVLAVASIVDYPLRVPSIAAFATILAVWLAQTRSIAKAVPTSPMAFGN